LYEAAGHGFGISPKKYPTSDCYKWIDEFIIWLKNEILLEQDS